MTDPFMGTDALSGADGTQPPEPYPVWPDPLVIGEPGAMAPAAFVLPPLPVGPDPEEMRRAIAAALADDEPATPAPGALPATPAPVSRPVFPAQGRGPRLPTGLPPLTGPAQAWEQVQRHVQVRRQVARGPVAPAPPPQYRLPPYQRSPQRQRKAGALGSGCAVGFVIVVMIAVIILVSVLDAVG